jgi:hypothetical protein
MTAAGDGADDAAAAREAADEVARRVLAAEAERGRAGDPGFDLRLEDYDAEVTRVGEPDEPVWEVRYSHANPQVPFIVPTGHPRHFTVRLGPGADDIEVTPGE